LETLVKNFLESRDFSGRLCAQKTHFSRIIELGAAVSTNAGAAVAAASISE
jgi:hypothetical protein